MVLSSMAVSFAHGANDGQKGMGIIMLILIGLLPANFALDKGLSPAGYARISGAMANIEDVLLQQRAKQPSQSDLQKARMENVHQFMTDHGVAPMVMLDFTPLIKSLEETRKVITAEQVHKLSKDATWELRMTVLMIDESVTDLIRSKQLSFSPKDIEVLTENQKVMRSFAEYVPIWVMFGVAIALGAGTMIGWKRIVVTVGEKIGKTQMTYAQGLTASVVTAGTIALGNFLSLPVSTTHVLSSSVAGTMSANKVGLQVKTVKNILLAWVLTFPAAVVLAGVIYALLLAVVHG